MCWNLASCSRRRAIWPCLSDGQVEFWLLSLTPFSLLTHCYLRTRESILVPTFFVPCSCFCLKVLVVCSLLFCCLLLFPCIPIYDWVLATVWCHHRPYFSSIACLGTWLPILKVPELAQLHDAQITGKRVLVFLFFIFFKQYPDCAMIWSKCSLFFDPCNTPHSSPIMNSST